ncbi:Hint domain-containing protein [Embleya scabrispora]|uniref:Hint domain-containing protein n=1 Tax=Embleya scabrispora TaxID=159449 RepID=UPI001319F3D3|nr:Hint domain-containing protein [Embleya scabrispora]MYS84326.1 hypothetical protein [Streptomyces sp. SID5474]
MAKYAEDLAAWQREQEAAAAAAAKKADEAAASAAQQGKESATKAKSADGDGKTSKSTESKKADKPSADKKEGKPAKKQSEEPSRATGDCNSFIPGTEVLMADGSARPIEEVKLGDLVLATDPVTNTTGSEPVAALIVGEGRKHLVELGFDSTGDGTAVEKVTATAGHPFWLPEHGTWVEAGDLRLGEWLRAASGRLVRIVEIRSWTQPERVHNLTVSNRHTYYVQGRNTPVLVHNTSTCPVPKLTDNSLKHSFDRHAAQWFGGEPKIADFMPQWQALIENAMRSSKIVPWPSGSRDTHACISRVQGKWFVAQFDRSSGVLVTAFRPNRKQLSSMLKRLG